MNDDRTRFEVTMRNALHDAADHAPLRARVPIDASRPIPTSRHHSRARALVAVCVLLIGIVTIVGVVALSHDDGGGRVRIAAPAGSAREVPASELPSGDTDLVVFMTVRASDEDVALVRDDIETSADVERYAFVDRDATWQEFATTFACNPDLVNSVKADDLPVSFRIVATADDARSRLATELGTLPGVEAIQSPDSSASPCVPGGEVAEGDVTPGQVGPTPSTTPPTLPPAGDQPTDAQSAHDAVVAAFTQAWDGSSSIEQRRAAMQASDQLAAELDRARAGNEATIATMRAVVGDVTFVAPDRAAVVYHLEFQGSASSTRVGYAVLDGDVWKVSRETVCDVLSTNAGVVCPAS